MRHLNKKKTLGREHASRKALFKSLASAFILEGKITTTHSKARICKSYTEKLITRARKQDLANIRYIRTHCSPVVAKKLFERAKTYADRKGGYTRIIKLSSRVGDRAPMSQLQFV